MNSYQIWKRELQGLTQFLEGTLFAYDQTEEVLRYMSRRHRSSPQATGTHDLVLLTPVRYKSGNTFHCDIRRHLRELLFIRIVSALEVYLVDTVRDTFVVTKVPFMTLPGQITFAPGELLSMDSTSQLFSKLINTECRKLTSGGFSVITTFYQNRLHCDISSVPPGLTAMEEYHDRRHLLVHRRGKIDPQYRHKYACEARQLTVSADYISSCLHDFAQFVDGLQLQLNKWREPRTAITATLPELRQTFAITHDPVEEPPVLLPSFQFLVQDNLFSMRDILAQKHTTTDGQCELTLAGTAKAVRVYARILKGHANAGRITVQLITTEQHPRTTSQPKADGKAHRKAHLPIEDVVVDQIGQILPPQPWPKGIHKVVAQKLGIKPRMVQNGIRVLIQRGVVFAQRDGQILASGTETATQEQDLSQS